ncbi:acetyl/propionyl/methylcrotonyl-CoA carboxylase subunit alpha [Hyphococcus lacteus]|uniref:Acetyl-CoA carboxylase biotin carboxylase subunit n=1 Tax=Hyphococcus lacteus TaxID=3143536 RepID=A0ABV3Z4B3_9PROT
MTTIRRLLIANRGEIACRIIDTARGRGIETIAVYADADVNARHVRLADQAEYIGPSEAAKSYLNIEAIIAAARRSGADAIHPGYGFLSERADFARECVQAGIIFVGPPADAISAMGDKASAKERMLAADVPCIPGYQGADQSESSLKTQADAIGYPVMVKASAGGGGRGMRIVRTPQDLSAAIQSARVEAENAFGDGRLLLERAVIGARHIEIQIFADQHGNCVYLGERDCSLQRRNQKVIEEAPSPVLSDDQRKAMGEAAVKAAMAVGYMGAGTVEFLYDPARGEFYFLEMNTRLQVEHPVTEMVTGLDLVAMQIDVAEGRALTVHQPDIQSNGWSIEARLYAEDPSNNFTPHSGEVRFFQLPENTRCDSGIDQGDDISSYYDPMVAKVIAHGQSRDEARAKLIRALNSTTMFGVANNRDFLVSLLSDETFAKGEAATNYIEENLDRLGARSHHPLAIALVGAALLDTDFSAELSGWNSRGSAGFPLLLRSIDGVTVNANLSLCGQEITVACADNEAKITVTSKGDNQIHFVADGRKVIAKYFRDGNVVELDVEGHWHRFSDITLAPASGAAGGDGVVKAPMAGMVANVSVNVGDTVSKGQVVATIEAMKMEHQLKAARDGIVLEVNVKSGDQVAIRTKLVVLKTEE